MVDAIGHAIAQREAKQIFFAFERFKGYESVLAGRQVTDVSARGKAVLVFFSAREDDGPWCVYSHNQLYGQWRITAADTVPKSNRQLRFAVFSQTEAARLYSASDIRLLRPDALHDVPYLARLGPDPLNQAIDASELTSHFADRRFSGRALGGLLLDQGFVAGVGNYLRSEILFDAGIDPARRPKDLDDTNKQRLAESTYKLIERTYRLKGVTNEPERVKRLKKQGLSFGQRRHMVFNREGCACYQCNREIVKMTVANRRLYYCPVCQAAAC